MSSETSVLNGSFYEDLLFAQDLKDTRNGGSDFEWTPLFALMQTRKLDRQRGGLYKRGLRDGLTFAFVMFYAIIIAIVFIFNGPGDFLEVQVVFIVDNWAWLLAGIMILPLVLLLKIHFPPLFELCVVTLACTILVLLITNLACTNHVDVMLENQVAMSNGSFNPFAPSTDPQWNSVKEYYFSTCVPASVIVACIGGAICLLLLVMYLWNYYLLKWIIQRNSNNPKFFKDWFGVEPTQEPCTFSYKASRHTFASFLPIISKREYFTYRGGLLDKLPNGQGTWVDSNGETLTGMFKDGLPYTPWKSFEKDSANAFVSIPIVIGSVTEGAWNTRNTKRAPLHFYLASCEASCSGLFFSHLPARSLLQDPFPLQPANGREALIFVHGWKTSAAGATSVVGQFASFLNLDPSRFSIFVFNWAAGGLSWFKENQTSSGSRESRDGLVQFLLELRNMGYSSFHLVSHSMGSRVVTSLGLDDALSSVFDRDAEDLGLGKLKTMIYFSPEVDVEAFTHNFPGLRRYCPAIVLYTDRHDYPLQVSAIVSKKPTTGKNPRSLYVQVNSDGQVRPPDFGKQVETLPRNVLGLTHSVVQVDGTFKRKYLDCDVIDNTHLDANVPFVRHSYFVFSRIMADDVFDVLTDDHRRRAKDRARLQQRDTNYYQFAVAPNWKKM